MKNIPIILIGITGVVILIFLGFQISRVSRTEETKARIDNEFQYIKTCTKRGGIIHIDFHGQYICK